MRFMPKGGLPRQPGAGGSLFQWLQRPERRAELVRGDGPCHFRVRAGGEARWGRGLAIVGGSYRSTEGLTTNGGCDSCYDTDSVLLPFGGVLYG